MLCLHLINILATYLIRKQTKREISEIYVVTVRSNLSSDLDAIDRLE